MKEEGCGYSCTYEKRDFNKMLERLWDFAQYDPDTALQIASEFESKAHYIRYYIERLSDTR